MLVVLHSTGCSSCCAMKLEVLRNCDPECVFCWIRYVLSSKIEKKPTDYVFIYYRGKNDAWDGYGGAVVYTRSRTLPPSIVPELQAAAKRVNLDFNKFTATDNTCGPEAPLFARLEKKVLTYSQLSVT